MSYETEGVYVSNCYRGNGLAAIFHRDSMGFAFSGNLLNAAPPYPLFPNPVNIGDLLYIGIAFPTEANGLFSNVIFDISHPSTAQFDVWTYGVFLTPFPDSVNRTGNFDVPGLVSLSFTQVSTAAGWLPEKVRDVYGLWIRRRCIAAGLPPVVKNRPYTVGTPYIETDELDGDTDALGKIEIKRQFYSCGSRTIIGRRNVSRGNDFSAYINLSRNLNPPGVTVDVNAPQSVFQAETDSTNGEVVYYNALIGDTDHEICTITIDSEYANQYTGKFLFMLRFVTVTPAAAGFYMKMVISTGNIENIIFNPQYKRLLGLHRYTIFNYGIAEIPSFKDAVAPIYIRFYATSNVNEGVQMSDLILLPADELLLDTYKGIDNIAIDNAKDYKLTIDSLHSKERLSSIMRDENGLLNEYMRIVSSNPVKIGEGNKYRYWFHSSDTLYDGSRIEGLSQVKFNHTSRYLSMRGER